MYTALLLLAFAAGDPIPKESDEARIKREWGELADSSEKSTIKLSGKKLKMTLPAGGRRPGNSRSGNDELAPYVFKTFEGNFVAQVTVHGHSAPDSAIAKPNEIITGSGLIAIFDEKTALTFCRATMPPKGEFRFYSSMRYLNGGMTSTSGPTPAAQKESTILRLTRTTNQLDMEYSLDEGKKWQRFTLYQRPTNSPVKIGVYAEHTCETVTEATFSDFSLKAYDPEKK
ncbi:MAG: hypothetical protein U0798_03995 [Gemmataceae bacterium]